MSENLNDMAKTAGARSNVYGLLSMIYMVEPSSSFIDELRDGELSQALTGLGLSLGDDFRETPVNKLVEDLAVEYAKLFIGPGPHLSPHESVHIDTGSPADNELWGAQTVKVKCFIEAAGLSYDEKFSGMPDHISAELDLMKLLAEKEAQAWSAGNKDEAMGCLEVQKKFFDEHLSKWAPQFCGKVAKKATLPYYREMAEVTKKFLEFEQENLNECLKADSLPQ